MIVWIEQYVVQFDGLAAVPVDENGPAKEWIERGRLRVVAEDDATKINEKFATLGPDAKQWLDELLTARKMRLGIA